MSVKIQVQMTEKYMSDFMFYHNYTRASGLITLLAGALCIARFVIQLLNGGGQATVWLICAIVFLVVNPYSIKNKAKAQVANSPMFQKPLEYEISESGVMVRQEEQEGVSPWDAFTKVVGTRKCVLMYMGRMRAIILPKECIGEQYESFVTIVKNCMPRKKVKIK